MSALEEYNLSAGAVARLTDPTPDLQRNYRQRDMIDGYGEKQENGRYNYNIIDLVGFWICDRLSQRGQVMDRRDGFAIGRRVARGIIVKVIKNERGIEHRPSYRYMLSDGCRLEGKVYGSSIGVVSNLSAVADLKFDRIEIINIDRLAKTMPAEIKALVMTAAENEADKFLEANDE
ncbi:MAG: hypothetical protein HKO95_06230 [Rhodobacteraceae bacterium]|nr:hypothetical protein [Paracoccaceae bacterium]